MASSIPKPASSQMVNPYTLAEIKGLFTQKKVHIVIGGMIERKIIKNGGENPRFGYYDGIKKIDFFIYPWDGEKIKLQVKSSYNRQDEEMCKRLGIYFLVVPPSMDFWEIEEKILEILAREEKKQKSKP